MSQQDQILFNQINGINTEDQDFDFLSIDLEVDGSKESDDIWGTAD